MINSSHIDASLAKIRVLFEEASEVIESLKPGEKIPATKLAEEIAKKHGLTGPVLYPVLKFLFDGYPDVDVKRGAHGGLCRKAASPVTDMSEVKF
jgi:hypothetical protein